MRTVTELISNIGRHARIRNWTTVMSDYVSIMNERYRWMAKIFPFPEFRSIDESITLVDGQEAYTLSSTLAGMENFALVEVQSAPTSSSSEGELLEGIDSFGGAIGTSFYPITPPTTYTDWSKAGRVESTASEEVRFYQLFKDGETFKIHIRPVPTIPSGTTYKIRITGIVSPVALTSTGTDTTLFRLSTSDDAFERFVAHNIVSRFGFDAAYAKNLFDEALMILRKTFGDEQMPFEYRQQNSTVAAEQV